MAWAQQLAEGPSLGPHDSFVFNLKTIATLVLTCLCALLANAAGIGGGPIYLPLLMVCKPKHEHVNLLLINSVS